MGMNRRNVTANGVVPFTGQVKVDSGSFGAPSVADSGDLDSGIYFPSADQFAIAVGGVTALNATEIGGLVVISTYGRELGTLFSDTDWDNNEASATTLGAGQYGLLMVAELTTPTAELFYICGTASFQIGGNALFTNTKDNGSTYNVYFDSTDTYVQNKVGDNKSIKVRWLGQL